MSSVTALPVALDRPAAHPSNATLLGYAAMIGLVGGLVATAYYIVLSGLLANIWGRLHLPPLDMPIEPTWRPSILIVTTLGGLIVGLFTRWLGSAGELAAVVDNIHLRHGRIDWRQTPSMTFTSLSGIAAGGSAGPEAPLVQIIGSFASWLGDRLKMPGPIVRTFTFCGMGAALGALFGAPLGGALFALEIPHRRGIEYYESLLPALVASLIAFLSFRSIVGYEAVLFHLPDVGETSIRGILWGLLFGAIGAGVAALFALTFKTVGHATHRFAKHPVWLATFGGLSIGLLAQLAPMSLFWGEYQIDRLANQGAAIVQHHTVGVAVALLLGLAAAKILAVSLTLHSGFRGGFIFPLMFIGAAVGVAAHVAFPAVPAAIAIVALMAAVNVAITKTPVSTCVILTTLTGTSQIPILIAASMASLLLSGRLTLIRTQRSRVEEAAAASESLSS